jgi:hypothetical protein
MPSRNKNPILVGIFSSLISVNSFASDTNNQRDQSAAQEPERTGNILQLRDSLLFTRRISMDIGFNTASERINAPVVGQDGRLMTNAASGFANSFSLGVRAPVQRLFNIGLTSRWSEQSGSSSRRFSRAAMSVSKSFNASPTDSVSLVANYIYSRPDIANSKLASNVGASISWFRSLDPVVIGLGFSHEQQSKEVQINNLRYRQSDTNSLSATMAFAINDQMSLSLTSAASRLGSSTVASINVPRQSAVSTSFSFGYAPTKQDSFFVSSSVGSTGGSTSMGLGMTYTKRFF